jgi:Rhodopirellula transposase DDE domain
MRTGLTIGPPEDIAMTIAALGAGELCNVYGSTETYGGSRVRLWKRELQKLANELGLDITVSHLPPGTSKWTKSNTGSSPSSARTGAPSHSSAIA